MSFMTLAREQQPFATKAAKARQAKKKSDKSGPEKKPVKRTE